VAARSRSANLYRAKNPVWPRRKRRNAAARGIRGGLYAGALFAARGGAHPSRTGA
jgi:hypothetical protein